jgi:hypothetical protein
MQCKVEFTARVDRAVDSESTRYALAGVQVTPDPDGGVFCAATNSRILTVTRQTGEADETCVVPGTLVAGKAGERNAVVEYDETARHWQRTALLKGSRISRMEPMVEGRFPRVGDVLPDFSGGPVLSVSVDPRQLLQAAEAMGCDDEQRAITLLVRIPRSENVLPSSIGVITAIRGLIDDGDTDHSSAARKLWALAVNEDGSWEVGCFTDENRLSADWGLGRWFVVVTYRPATGTFDPTVCADALLTLARTKFTSVGLNIVEPIALLNMKQNIGVIMPCAYDEKRDERADYLDTRRAFSAALNIAALNAAARNFKTVAATPVVEPEAIAPGEPDDTLADAPISIETLQAQLTALLAQCA